MANRRDAVTSASALAALLPGFLFPFVLARIVGTGTSDLFLLATSASLTLTSIIGSAVEMHSMSEVGRTLGRGVVADRRSSRSYERRILLFVLVTTLVLGPALVALYSLSGPPSAEFWLVSMTVLLVPAVGGMAAIRSGHIIAHGKAAIAIALQSTRSMPPLVVVVAWPQVPLLGLALAFVAGELIRFVALTVVARRLEGSKKAESVDLQTTGLISQSAATATANGSPVTDRFFLAGHAGGITAFEIADKLFFAASQFLNFGFLVRRVGHWSRLPVREPATGKALLRTDSVALLVVTSIVALLGALGLAVAPNVLPIPNEWGTGLAWTAILFVSIPMSMGITVISRLLIIARRQKLLFKLSFMSFAINALFDWVLFIALGPIGIPVATVIARTLALVGYALVARRVVPDMLGADRGRDAARLSQRERPPRERAGLRVSARWATPSVMALATIVLTVVAVASPFGTLTVAVILAVLIVLCIPLWTLPSIALVMYACLPVGYIVGVPELVGRYFAPAVVVLLIWVLKAAWTVRAGRVSVGLIFWPFALLVVLVLESLFSVQPVRSAVWVAVFAIAALVPALHGRHAGHRAVTALTGTWLAVGCVLGAAAIVESMTRFNPLAQFYTVEQTWAVYRVTTTLGHPLMNATFFSATACFALFIVIRRGSRWPFALCAFFLSGIASALSGSRSAIVALAVGIGVGLIAVLLSRGVSFASKLVSVGGSVFAVFAVANLPLFAERGESAEARSSSDYRDFTWHLATRLIDQNPLFGAGPSTSGLLAVRTGAPHPLENAILGTIVSVGIVGGVCLAAFLVWLGIRALRTGRIESLAALASFVTSGAAFPLWESVAASFVVVGLIAIVGARPDTVTARGAIRLPSIASVRD